MALPDFDPFARGPFPVGVRTLELVDVGRGDRPLTVEVWYPATARSFGLDVSLATSDVFSILPDTPPLHQAAVRDADVHVARFPLVIFSHTSLGHRRQSTFLSTHLASHGFVVAGPDHTGNTLADLIARAASGVSLTESDREAMIARIIADRVPDLRCVADQLLSMSDPPFAEHLDGERLGLIGWSFGGWAVLAVPEVDPRFSAVVAMAPGGASRPLPGLIPATLTYIWLRDVSTLYLAAERDRYTLLSGIEELLERTPGARRLFVLRYADHDHFGDHIEPELVPRQHAHLFARSLALAHFEATLKANTAAAEFLEHDAVSELRARGIALD
jgi:dienelactone hydrolase